MKIRRIRVFEREALRIGDGDGELKLRDVEAIAHYEERERLGAFQIGWKCVRTGEYVGVFTSDDLVLEILPKAERVGAREGPGLYAKWSNALLAMLSVAYDLPLEESGFASHDTTEESLLDVYACYFIRLVEGLVRGGLVKGYRRIREKLPAMRGKVIANMHGMDAAVHQERLLCEFDIYDLNTPHNMLLALALDALGHAPLSPRTRERARRLSEALPEVGLRRVTSETFDKLSWDRRSHAYRPAIDMARMILLGFSPLQSHGGSPTLALLFQMNMLFESYIGTMVQRSARTSGWSVSLQISTRFWDRRTIRPDILMRKNGRTVVLDTKWKVLTTSSPSIDDVRQLYVYNRYFNAKEAWLVYPSVYGVQDHLGSYRSPDADLQCGLAFIDLFSGENLSKTIGASILALVDRPGGKLKVPIGQEAASSV